MNEITASSIDKVDKARFWGHVSKSQDCWEWKSVKSRAGYGRFYLPVRRAFRAHRVAYALVFGKTPAGLMVCHHCDNPACVNPEHLFLGTNRDNVDDQLRKGRVLRGEQNGMAKLTSAMAVDIRKLFSLGHNKQELGRRFGVCRKAIYNILVGKTWQSSL